MTDYRCTFYFTSGLSVSGTYTQEEVDMILTGLKKNWSMSSIVNSSYGINFALVTHYEIKKIEQS